MDNKDYEKLVQKGKIERIKKLKIGNYVSKFFKVMIKLLPIVISLLAFLFSIMSFTHSKYTEKLSYRVKFDTNQTVDVKIGDNSYKLDEVSLVRNTGYIDKTSLILFKKGNFMSISQLPTSDFITEIPFDLWLQPRKMTTEVRADELPVYFSNKETKYTYYFILVHGMDNSKHLHMVTYLISKDTIKSNIYSEVTVLGMKTTSNYLKQAKEDFFELKTSLIDQNLL